MAAKMTRRRALELAMECILARMNAIIAYYNGGLTKNHGGIEPKDNPEYAELAAALAWLEHAARQGEMHL